MGRSKFPGKPSKSINRKRISVLQLEEAPDEDKLSGATQQATVSEKSNCDDDHEKGNSRGGSGRRGGGGASGSAGGGTGSSNNTNAAKAGRGVNGNSSGSSSGVGSSGGGSDASGKSHTTANTKTTASASSDICSGVIVVNIDKESDNNNHNDSNSDDDDDDDDGEEEEEEDEIVGHDDDNDDVEDDNASEDLINDVHNASDLRNKNNNKKSKNSDNKNISVCSSSSSSSSSNNSSTKNFLHSNKKFKNLNVGKEVMLPSSSKEKLRDSDSTSFATCKTQSEEVTTETCSANVDVASGAGIYINSHDPVADGIKTAIVGGVGYCSGGKAGDNEFDNFDTEKTTNRTDNLTNNKLSEVSTSSSNNSIADADTNATSVIITTESEAENAAAATKLKKTVTFKNILETSDDKSAVKKFYNPDNRRPLVSIMKKECMNRAMMYSRSNECIVRPSRLTEILKNNSNIDKLNLLKFRSSSSSLVSANKSSSISIFSPSLSRAFGAPDEDEDEQQDAVTFRIHETFNKDIKDARDVRNVVGSVGTTEIYTHEEMHHDNVGGESNDDNDDDVGIAQQQIIVDKYFVLPKRSTRSSRVIKPNKRFLDEAVMCKKPNRKLNAKANKEMYNYFGLGKQKLTNVESTTASTSALCLGSIISNKELALSKSNSFALKSMKLPFSGAFNPTTNSNSSKFVLRQPRLQFDSRNCGVNSLASKTLSKSSTLPTCSNRQIGTAISGSNFSLGSSGSLQNNAVLSNSSNCYVCSTQIHSKNIQQSRKYGVLACEMCRKFISKITKKSVAANASPTIKSLQLQCKSDGNCAIHPPLKAHLKNFKKIYKERCSACWLKRCIQEFQFPSGHKLRLSAILPTSLFKQENDRIEKVLKKEDVKAPTPAELIGSSNLFVTTSLNQKHLTQSQQIKWKPTESTPGEGLKLKIKSNLLSENNATFGSSPLLRPALLEQSMFLKNIMEQQHEQQQEKEQQVEKQEEKNANLDSVYNSNIVLDKSLEKATTETSQKQTKLTKRREKLDKEKEKQKEINKDIKSPTANKQSGMSTVGNGIVATKTNDSRHISTSSAVNISSTTNAIETNNVAFTGTIGETSTTTTTITTTTALTNATDAKKRQRVALKGPRVKHVCRSASIVLGQPLAMFGEDEEDADVEENEETQQAANSDSPKTTRHQNVNYKEIMTETEKETKTLMAQNENRSFESLISDSYQKNAIDINAVKVKAETKSTAQLAPAKIGKVEALEDTLKSSEKKSNDFEQKSLHLQQLKTTTRQSSNISNGNSLVATINKKHLRHEPVQQQVRRKESQLKLKTTISIDFWENYDPAEVCQTGFGLIVTETVAQRALCFLCGSAGLDPLIFCACCCEPYHQYCVLDEYNLKHSSLDDTMASLLDSSFAGTHGNNSIINNLSMITQRLNWLCPRCTICYTCNMSSGAKVRCQKCQKNYHSTCLGTSKRLLGADRPLICVNCLKCKSCSTAKVSKFVGNLPMCTACFKLRKKGNYCPICQKCYDDNDFDLKMMECGNCKQWVHSKCEGLSDEQYNLLSTLPESTEFVCKKCSKRDAKAKQKAEELRLAVMEEFKSTLLSVLKLLSKSRQACALLKLSPRKKVRCTCGSQVLGERSMQPKCLQFSERERDTLGSDGESHCSEDVYEFKDNSVTENEELRRNGVGEKCFCMTQSTSMSTVGNLNLVDIKKKICSGNYVSLAEFNYDMNTIIQNAACDELIIAYKEILSEQFPWFQNETKACTDALEEDMFESCGAYGSQNSLDSHNDYQHQRDDEPEKADMIDLPEDIDNVIYSLKKRNEQRVCLFCRKTGEGQSNDESRLIYCGHDCWVHTNCAMWSAEVFEEIDGSLQNVHSAVARGRMIKCTVCNTRGATVGCNVKSCGEHYHYPCARSIECAFLTDKTMYCPGHAQELLKSNSASIETCFHVSRPVYVELDRKRKKLIEPNKVQFHIGSLEVKQLGTIFPKFSDTFEALIPINFLCSRLYWSQKEPWKLVEYTVRTMIQNNYASYTNMDSDKHFTVDHTNANASIIGLAQITRWHNSLAARCEFIDYAAIEPTALTTLSKLLPAEYFPQNQCSSSATDENTEEEPQTNADLLPPEIKDAIFEDLPHEILDGISMLDIFPKFMIYEDIVNLEGTGNKVETQFNESKDGGTNATVASNISISDEDTVNSSSFSKQLELSNSWSSNGSNIAINHVEDAMLAASRQAKRGAENSLQILKKTSNSQRSWTKLDSNAAIKRRKISKGIQDFRIAEGVLLSLNQTRSVKKELSTSVTGTAALTRRQSVNVESVTNTVSRAPFTWSAAKRYPYDANVNKAGEESSSKLKLMQVDGVDDSITEYRIITNNGQHITGTVKCDRCHCTYRTYDSFQRHLATCEPLSTSESESETAPRSPDVAGSVASPLLNEHEFNKLSGQRVTTSTHLNGGTTTNIPFIQAFPQTTNIPIGNVQANINSVPINVQSLQNLQGLQQLQGLQNIQLQNLQPQGLGSNFFISQTTSNANTNMDDLHFYGNSLQGLATNLTGGGYTLTAANAVNGFGNQTANLQQQQQQPQLIAVSTNPDGTQQIIQIPTATAQPQQQHNVNAFQQVLQQAAAAVVTNGNEKKVMLKTQKQSANANNKVQQQLHQSITGKQKLKACNSIKPIQSKVAPCSTVTQQQLHTQQPITVFGTSGTTNTQLINQNMLQQMQLAQQQQQQQQPQIIFQTTNNAGQQQPIIMQQLGTATNNSLPAGQNIISFISNDGTHQQQPQMQYVSIPTVGNNSNPLMQGAFIQADSSGNLVLTTAAQQPTTAMQMISATPLNQPQVIGTIIQPQTLQLGSNVLTATDPTSQQQQQLIIGNTATGLEMITATNSAAPQVILTTQPMYYGLETIVQNTVMSSQQFVSTAMPGVLSQNASFSATTTQVFQASKIEPIVDMPTTSYVVLNNVDAGSSISAQPSYLNTTNTIQHQQQQQQQPQQQIQNMQTTSADVQQQHNLIDNLQPQQQQPTVYRLQTQTNNAVTPVTLYQTHSQQQSTTQYKDSTANQHQQQQIITAKVPPVTQAKRNNASSAKSSSMATITKVQPHVVNKVIPTTAAPSQKSQVNYNKTLTVQRNSKAHTLDSNVAATTVTAELMQQVFSSAATTSPATTTVTTISTNQLQNLVRKVPNVIRPINKAEIKPKLIKTTIATNKQQQQQKQQQYSPQQQQQLQQELQIPAQIKVIDFVDDINANKQQQKPSQDNLQQYMATNTSSYNNNSQNCYIQQQEQQQDMVAEFLSSAMDNNDAAYQTQQDMIGLVANSSTNSSAINSRLQYTATSLNNNAFSNSNVPTNIVNPIQQQIQYSTATPQQQNNTASYISRPTNRVLPMQQRQESIVASGLNKTSTQQLTAATKATEHQNNRNSKCFETDNRNKTAYETEIKKAEQQLLQHELEMITSQQSDNNAEYKKFLLQEKEEHANVRPDNLSKTVGGDNDTHVMEAEAAELTCQQFEIVADNLENLAASIMCAEKERQEHSQQHLESTSCHTLVDIVGSAGENEIGEFDDVDGNSAGDEMKGGGNENLEVNSGEEYAADDDNDEEEGEDDDFSLKMPTDDADQEISDSDEPAVKAKINKILDNLTNDECTEALRTTVTTPTSQETGNTFIPMVINERNVHLLNEENQNNYCSSHYEQQIATQETINSFTFNASGAIDGMEANMVATMDIQAPEPTAKVQLPESSHFIDTSKICNQVSLDCSTATTNATIDIPVSFSISEKTKVHQTQNTYKITPPQHPARDPQKITGPHLLYEIQSDDGFTYKSTSITEIWEKVFEAVQVARRAHGLAPLPEGPLADMSGLQMIGLKTNALKYLIEQLPGVEKCSRYTPKYHKRSATLTANSTTLSGASLYAEGSSANNSATHCDTGIPLLDYISDQDDLVENVFESARCEPFSKRSDYDMFSWLASRHRKQPIQVFVQPSDSELMPRRGTGSNLPMAMKYRTLKETYKDYVGVFRSHIHGRGLYCTKDIEAGEMVIEYAGELIRSTLTDKRERSYNSRGIGCYMFKIDENLVVDATMRGNAARFINHSCEPNCYSKVVDILGHKHIIIFALRRIVQGEELTYDYKFPFEDEKIPCSCGSKKCRKYLN